MRTCCIAREDWRVLLKCVPPLVHFASREAMDIEDMGEETLPGWPKKVC